MIRGRPSGTKRGGTVRADIGSVLILFPAMGAMYALLIYHVLAAIFGWDTGQRDGCRPPTACQCERHEDVSDD